ncbi:hypothetical protein ACFZCG_40140, partial [Streptomyces tanashiensis]
GVLPAVPAPGTAHDALPAVPVPAVAEGTPVPAAVPTPPTPPAEPGVPAPAAAPEPAGGLGTRPRFGTVAMPSRTQQARRGDMPSVRAVRLTDEPPAPVDRTAAAATAAVTPVPLPVPRPAPRAVPTESRTEEPQP